MREGDRESCPALPPVGVLVKTVGRGTRVVWLVLSS